MIDYIDKYNLKKKKIGAAFETDEKIGAMSASAQPLPQEIREPDVQHFEVEGINPMALLEAEAGQGVAGNRAPNPLEAFLGPNGFHQLLDIPPADDDEAMVEFAIALSLQDHEAAGVGLQALQQGFQQGLSNLQNLSGQALQSLQAFAAQGLAQVQGAVQVTNS